MGGVSALLALMGGGFGPATSVKVINAMVMTVFRGIGKMAWFLGGSAVAVAGMVAVVFGVSKVFFPDSRRMKMSGPHQ